MRAFVINLDRARDRWASIERVFANTSFELCRVPAVDGMALSFPIKEYSEKLYRTIHGKPTQPREVGCYLSHVKAIEAFLATGDAHGLVCEDDITLGADFEEVLRAAMAHSAHWNILRLTGLSTGHPMRVAKLCREYTLNVNIGRLKGLGVYVMDRAAAAALVPHLLPMGLPIDHALDREWFCGMRAAYVLPFPASQVETGFKSSIQVGKSLKLAKWRRYLTVYPYQVFNEVTRWVFRVVSYIGMRLSIRV